MNSTNTNMNKVIISTVSFALGAKLLPRLLRLFSPKNKPDAKACIDAIDTAEEWDGEVPRVVGFVDGEPFANEDELVAAAKEALARGGSVKSLVPDADRQYYRFAAVVAREVKNRMGCPKRSAANWLVAHDLVQKVLAERHVRKVDRIKFAPLATQMVFVPTRFDVMARKFAESAEVASREAEFEGVNVPWWRRLFGIHRTWSPPAIERG